MMFLFIKKKEILTTDGKQFEQIEQLLLTSNIEHKKVKPIDWITTRPLIFGSPTTITHINQQ